MCTINGPYNCDHFTGPGCKVSACGTYKNTVIPTLYRYHLRMLCPVSPWRKYQIFPDFLHECDFKLPSKHSAAPHAEYSETGEGSSGHMLLQVTYIHEFAQKTVFTIKDCFILYFKIKFIARTTYFWTIHLFNE